MNLSNFSARTRRVEERSRWRWRDPLDRSSVLSRSSFGVHSRLRRLLSCIVLCCGLTRDSLSSSDPLQMFLKRNGKRQQKSVSETVLLVLQTVQTVRKQSSAGDFKRRLVIKKLPTGTEGAQTPTRETGLEFRCRQSRT